MPTHTVYQAAVCGLASRLTLHMHAFKLTKFLRIVTVFVMLHHTIAQQINELFKLQ